MTNEEYQKSRKESLKIMQELFEDNAEKFSSEMEECVFGLGNRWYIGDRIEDQRIRNRDNKDKYDTNAESEYSKESSFKYKKHTHSDELLETVCNCFEYDEDQFIEDLASILPKGGRWYVGDYAKERPDEIRR